MDWIKTRTNTVLESQSKKYKVTSGYIYYEVYVKVRLEKRVTIPVMSQAKLFVVSKFSVLVTFEPKHDFMKITDCGIQRVHRYQDKCSILHIIQ